MNTMNLNIQLLEGVSQKSPLQDNIDLIQEQSISLSNLINHFPVYSLTKQLTKANADVPKCIEELLQNIHWTKGRHFVRTELQTIGKNHLVRTNIRVLNQIFQKVLNNALEAFSENCKDPKISINIEFSSKYVKIMLVDNGPGMDQDTLNQLGKPFFTAKDNGAGLGLPLVIDLVENLQGNIRISSQPGTGTEIFIRLPYE